MISLPELRRCPRLRRNYAIQVMSLRPESPGKKLWISRGRTIEVSARGVSFDNADANCVDVGVEVEVSLLVPRTMGHPAPFFPALLAGRGFIVRIENHVTGTEFRQRVAIRLETSLRFDIRPLVIATEPAEAEAQAAV